MRDPFTIAIVMTSVEGLLLSDRIDSAFGKHIVQVVCLILFGIAFEAAIVAIQASVPTDIYSEVSYTLSLIERMPGALGLAVLSLSLFVWLLLPAGRSRFTWRQIDSVGGLRWLSFGIVATLAWDYSGYSYNYYYDQSHIWDRLLLVALMFGTLRSPLLITIFSLELLLSRGQFAHPINAYTPAGDKLPLLVLGIVVGSTVWNELLGRLERLRSTSRFSVAKKWCTPLRVPTSTLIYSILCVVGCHYAFTGTSKALLGENLTDWVRFNHLENLFVASHLNGWLSHVREARILEMADWIRSVSIPISAMAQTFELGMFFILFRQRGTLLLLAAISSMHVGIVMMSGIIYWKWMVLDLALLAWLLAWRNRGEIRRIYSRSNFVASVLLILGLMAFNDDGFAWWNTKWIKIYEIEALDVAGNSYLVDYADFSPYSLFDLYSGNARAIQSVVYGMSHNQPLMQRLEDADPARLKRLFTTQPTGRTGQADLEKKRDFTDFMEQYFKHRNRRPGRSVPPFFWPAPSLHNRRLSSPDLYRDQAPVVTVQLRFIEILYSGSKLHRMRDEVVHTVSIPDGERSSDGDD